MSLESFIYTQISTLSGLTAKVFPVSAPEGTQAPYVTYQSQPKDWEKALSGFLSEGRHTIEMDLFASTYSGLKTLETTVTGEIKGWIGKTMGSDTIQDVTFDFSPELYESEISLYRCILTFTLFY